jgi:hypothetical protein
VLAFGAGALISAVSFDLAQEGAQLGGPGTVAIGLAVGAVTYYVADARGRHPSGRDPAAVDPHRRRLHARHAGRLRAGRRDRRRPPAGIDGFAVAAALSGNA